MEITFNNNKLKRLAEDEAMCVKILGALRAKLFMKRLGDLCIAETLEDVRYLPGHYHELVGDRKGQWACSLDQPYRLIFEPRGNPIATNDTGQYLWSKIKSIKIIGIENYHE